VANSYNDIGNVYYSQDKYDDALDYHQKSLNIRITVFGTDHPDVAKSYMNFANVCDSQTEHQYILQCGPIIDIKNNQEASFSA